MLEVLAQVDLSDEERMNPWHTWLKSIAICEDEDDVGGWGQSWVQHIPTYLEGLVRLENAAENVT